jgi:hypothetical protein
MSIWTELLNLHMLLNSPPPPPISPYTTAEAEAVVSGVLITHCHLVQ